MVLAGLIVVLLLIIGVVSAGVRVDLSISRTFHRPLEFQLTDRFGTIRLRTIIHAGAGGYDHGPVSSDYTRELTPAEASEVRHALRALLASSPQPPSGFLLDGSHWLIRVRALRRMNLDIRSPDYDPEQRDTQRLYDFGRLLWHLAKIDEPESRLY